MFFRLSFHPPLLICILYLALIGDRWPLEWRGLPVQETRLYLITHTHLIYVFWHSVISSGCHACLHATAYTVIRGPKQRQKNNRAHKRGLSEEQTSNLKKHRQGQQALKPTYRLSQTLSVILRHSWKVCHHLLTLMVFFCCLLSCLVLSNVTALYEKRAAWTFHQTSPFMFYKSK